MTTTARTPRGGRRARAHGPLAVGLLAATVAAGLASVPARPAPVPVGFTTTTEGTAGEFASRDLDDWLPTSVGATRVQARRCQVDWTAAPGAAPGLTYDVTDGAGAPVVTGATTGPVVVDVPAVTVSPTVRVRLGSWTSASGRTSAAPCPGWPDAPALQVVPSHSQAVATWTAPASNGRPIGSYLATISPAGTGTSSCTVPAAGPLACTFTGLVDGASSTVSVSATNADGTGPSATATTIPYPSQVMSPARLRLWLDGADRATMTADPGCTGAPTSTAVGCWRDKSPAANHATQPSAPSRPSLASTVGGRPVPTFDDSFLALSAAALPTGSDPGTQLVVARLDGTVPAGGARAVLSYGGVGGERTLGTVAGSRTGSFGTGATSVPFSAWPAAASVVAASAGGGRVRAAADGRAYAAATASVSTGQAAAALGRRYSGSDPWLGPVPEVIVLSGELTDAERRVVDEYLARKWTIDLAPSTPTNVTAAPAGRQAAVSWAAPTSDGGRAVTGYTATAVPSDTGLPTRTCTATGTSCTVTGLTDGVTYAVSVTATNGVGTGSSSAAVSAIPYPADIMTPAATRLWLDGASPTSFSSSTLCGAGPPAVGGGVACWKDRSTYGNDLAQSIVAARPLLTLVAGRTVARFDGVDDRMIGTVAGLAGTASSTTFHVATLDSADPAADGERVLTNAGAGTAGGGRQLVKPAGSAAVEASAVGAASAVTDHVLTPAVPQLMVSVFDAASVALRVAGRPQVSRPFAYSTGADQMRLGTTTAATWTGPVQEVVVLDRALTAAQSRTVDEYLARKWAVPITASTPTAPNAVAGTGQATVSWSPPGWDGGSTVSRYTVTSSPGGRTCSTTGATSCVVTGLTGGTPYTFSVRAENAVGLGPAATVGATPS